MASDLNREADPHSKKYRATGGMGPSAFFGLKTLRSRANPHGASRRRDRFLRPYLRCARVF